MLISWNGLVFPFLLYAALARPARASRSKRTIVGYYPLCPRGCASCSSINGCVTCRPQYYLHLHRDGFRQTGMCLHSCPVSYFGLRQKNFNQCLRCGKPHCEACFNRSYCTRCEAPYLAYRGECVEQCPDGLQYATYTKDCVDKVNCVTSPWSAWGVCTRNGQTCGYKYGVQTRTRDVVQAPSANGSQCLTTTETRKCKLKYRSCVDLLHNRSDPSAHHSLQKYEHWKRRRNKLRRKWSRKYRKRRKERKLKRLLRKQKEKATNGQLSGLTANKVNSLFAVP